jgi:O-acetyl-ADP-ribose deacetylase (regulator of RNase III)
MADAKVFISYKNLVASRAVGLNIATELRKLGYDVFFDQDDLRDKGGVTWENVLETHLKSCEVLLVLIQKETSESEWVAKEIAMSRDAKATVVPIIIEDKEADVTKTLEALHLQQTQYLIYRLRDISNITQTIEERTIEVRKERELHDAWKKKSGYFKQYKLPNETCDIVLINDDATVVSNFDVLVNTENTFMQMARYFESHTLSAVIRRKGALIEDGYQLEDTVQEQLNTQVKYARRLNMLPLLPGQLVVTEAGHEDSELRKKFKYIIHAAAVTIDPYEKRITPMPLTGIRDVVLSCMEKVETINEAPNKVIFLEQGKTKEPVNFRELTSILFPLFGTGAGQQNHYEVAEKIILGFRTYIQNSSEASRQISKIGLCVYNPEHAQGIAKLFEKSGFKSV